jgi:hypothetical protein
MAPISAPNIVLRLGHLEPIGTTTPLVVVGLSLIMSMYLARISNTFPYSAIPW